MPQNGQKKVVITGCSSGFGYYTALKAASRGFNVVATMRNMTKADMLRSELEKNALKASIEHLDVTDQDSISQFAARHSDTDILVNNAGILIIGSFLTLSDQEITRVMETNYYGPVRLCRALTPAMMSRKSGLIINVASLAGLVGHPFNAVYSSSKHALVGFSRSIRLELRPFGIKVVSVEPGYHKTEIIRANANVSENFYDRQSPFFEWNRGFLRVMRDEIIPRAGEVQSVVDTICEIMRSDDPNSHYIIGKDAKLAMFCRKFGLSSWLENKVFRKIKTCVRLENKRAQSRKKKNKRLDKS